MSSQTSRSRLSRFLGLAVLTFASVGLVSATAAPTAQLLRVGAAKRSIQPCDAAVQTYPDCLDHVTGVDEPRFFAARHLQRFNLGGFGINFGAQAPDDPLGITAQLQALANDPVGARAHVNPAGQEDLTQLRAMAVEDPASGKLVLFVMIDAVGAGNLIQKGVKDAISQKVLDELDIVLPPEDIVFGQTHSHAGADLQGLWGGVPQDWVNNVLYVAAAEAGVEAIASRQPARLRMRQGYTSEFNSYRRPKITPGADADGIITLLTATSATGAPISSILQYSAHPTGVGAGNNPRVAHPDYVLGAMDWLEDPATGPGGIALYFNGPIADSSKDGRRAGCVNGDGDYGDARCRGQGVADHLLHAGNALADRELAPTLEAKSVEVLLPVTNPGFLAFGLAGAFNRYYNFMDVATDSIPGLQPYLNELPQLTPVARTWVTRVTLGGELGGLEIVTIPGETTNTFGQYIRGLAKTNVMLLGLTQNSFGYILPDEEFHYVNPTVWDDYFDPVPGTTYEEMVSLGPLTAAMLRDQGYVPLFKGAVTDPHDGDNLVDYVTSFLPPWITTCTGSLDDSRCITQIIEDQLHAVFLRGINGDGCRDGAGPFAPACVLVDALSSLVGNPVPEFTWDGAIYSAMAADALLHGCDILDRSNCLYPFPNDFFTADAAPGSIQSIEKGGTGRRVNFNAAAMPRNTAGKPVDPSEWNRNDGFSPGALITTYVPGLSLEQTYGLPAHELGLANIGLSQRANTPVFVIDATPTLADGSANPEYLKKQLVWAELDANANLLTPAAVAQVGTVGEDQARPTGDGRAALLIRPAKNFAEGHRYIVALRNLKDEAGKVIKPGLGFQLCRGDVFNAIREDTRFPVAERCDHIQEVLETLGEAEPDFDPAALFLAWDFTVASTNSQIGRLRHMRDEAFRTLSRDPADEDCTEYRDGVPCAAPTFTVDKVTENVNGSMRRIEGTLTVPSFVVPADPAPADGADGQAAINALCDGMGFQEDFGDGCHEVNGIAAGAALPPNRLFYSPADGTPAPDQSNATDATGLRYGDGLPDATGTMQTHFWCQIPQQASPDAPARAGIYGHGLLDRGVAIGYDGVPELSREFNFMFCAIDWFGFATGDLVNVASQLTDVSNFPVIPDASQQGMVNFMFLARALRDPRGFASHEAFQGAGGRPRFNGEEVFYDGNSQGGILGGVVLAASKDVNRGVLGSLGMNYSTLLTRSKDFDEFAPPLYLSYPDPLDRQLLFSMIQMLWDRSENNGYAAHLTDNSAFGGQPKAVKLDPMFGDYQVTMWSADVMARTMGIPVDAQQIARTEARVQPLGAPYLGPNGRRHPDAVPYLGLDPLDYGTAEAGGSALVVWDQITTKAEDKSDIRAHTKVPPIRNVPPRWGAETNCKDDDCDPHDTSAKEFPGRCQKAHFFAQHTLVDVTPLVYGDAGASCPAIAPAAPTVAPAPPVPVDPLSLQGVFTSLLAAFNEALADVAEQLATLYGTYIYGNFDPPAPQTLDNPAPQPLQAGIAKAALKVPVGVPLGGYLRPPVGGEVLGGPGDAAGDGHYDEAFAQLVAEFGDSVPAMADDGTPLAPVPDEARKVHSPYATYFPPTRGYYDSLVAKAVAMYDGHDCVVLMKTDFIGMLDEVVQQVADQAQALLVAEGKLPAGCDLKQGLVMSATHTHDGPGALANDSTRYFWLAMDVYKPEVLRRIVPQAARIVADAVGSMQPAKFGYALGREAEGAGGQHTLNSYRNGHQDHVGDRGLNDAMRQRLGVLRVDTASGEPLAAIINYAAHGIAFDVENMYFSGDVLASAERETESALDVPLAMLVQNTGGNVNPRAGGMSKQYDGVSQLQRIERFGKLLAPQVAKVFNSVDNFDGQPDLRAVSQRIILDREHIGYPDTDGRNGDGDFPYEYGAAQCNNDVEVPFAGVGPNDLPGYGDTGAPRKNPGCIPGVPLDMADLADNGVAENVALYPQDTRLTAVRIGDATLLAQPGEPLTEYGVRLLAAAEEEGSDPAKTFIWGYSQDHVGYIMADDKADWERGQTEGTTTFWGWKLGDRLIRANVDLLRALRDETPGPTDEFQLFYFAESAYSRDAEATPSARPGRIIVKPAAIERFGKTRLVWEGGDPVVDLPDVTLQVRDGSGQWVAATRPNGEPISTFFEMHLKYALVDGAHQWTVEFEAPKDWPAGTYRFAVRGNYADRAAQATFAYAIDLAQVEFEVAPSASLKVSAPRNGASGCEVTLMYAARPSNYRLLDTPTDDNGDGLLGPMVENDQDAPVRRGTVTFSGGFVDSTPEIRGTTAVYAMPGACPAGVTASGSDVWGNTSANAPPPADTDGDGIVDGADNCPSTANPGQEDADGDGIGDACDSASGGDGLPLCQDFSGDRYCISDLDEFVPGLGSAIQGAVDTVYDAVTGGGGADTRDATLAAAAADMAARGCDMLDPAYCLFPFPNDHFTVPAADSSPQSTDVGGTGRRIAFNIAAMPRNAAGKPIDPTEWNRNDGFSPGQMIITYVPGIGTVKDAAGNPVGPIKGAVPITDLSQSLADDAAIFILDVTPGTPEYGTKQLAWAEIDLNAGYLLPSEGVASPKPKQAPLIIRPARNLLEGHRYVVVLRNLQRDDASIIPAGAAFAACLDEEFDSALPPVAARCAHLRDNVLEPIEDLAGVDLDPATLFLAWDFTVASAQNNVARLRHMRDDAFASLGDDGTLAAGQAGFPQGNAPSFTITSVRNNPSGPSARQIKGTFKVPSYLVPADGVALPSGAPAAKASLPPNRFFYLPDPSPAATCGAEQGAALASCLEQARYGDGLPDRNPSGDLTAAFTCNIPKAALSGKDFASATAADIKPARPSLYGHGLLGSHTEGGIGNGDGQTGALGNEQNIMICATDWYGFASGDLGNVASVLPDVSNFPVVPDASQQGVLNFLFLARLMSHPQGFAGAPEFRLGDTPVFDTREVFYDGNSQGGILGGPVVAMSKDIHRGVLGVPGMNYSTLLTRSVDFDVYSIPLYLAYPDDLDRNFIFSMMQMLWDRSENNGYAHHIADSSELNAPGNEVLLHPAFSDHQVSMWTAEVMARTIGATVDRTRVTSLRHPDDNEYFALDTLDYGNAQHQRGSAFVVWDNNQQPPPPIGNVSPREGSDPHSFPRGQQVGRCQKGHFLQRAGVLVEVPASDAARGSFVCPTLTGSGDTDSDGDGIADALDNCAAVANTNQANADGDAQGDACDGDDDNDTVLDGDDNCPLTAGEPSNNGCPVQQPDGDADGVPDAEDNCPTVANANQADNDNDEQGDACDVDDDNDNVEDGADECPTQAGPQSNNGCPGGNEPPPFPIPLCEPFTQEYCLRDIPGIGEPLEDALLTAWETLNGGGEPPPVEPPSGEPVEQLVADGAANAQTLPADVQASVELTAANAQNGKLAERSAEAVIMEGKSFPDWSQPAAFGLANPYPSGVGGDGEVFTGDTPFYVRDAHNGTMIYPPAGFAGLPTAAAVGDIAAFKYENGGWVEIPVQVDERFPYFLANANSGFSFYSGTDMELTYAWDRETWKADGGCHVDEASVAPMADPVSGLDDDDEIVFMAKDAGAQAPAGSAGPEGAIGGGQEIALADPLAPDAPTFVYLFRREGGSSFAAGHYVRYERGADANQWVDRSFFGRGGLVEPDQYGRNQIGTSLQGYGPNIHGTVCLDGTAATARPSEDRFPRDNVTISTDRYEVFASGRWMVRNVRIAKPGEGNEGNYGPDIVDRWKGRAFQQSPGTIDIVGFEDEQSNWEANSSLLGERAGPVRAIREIWGADSGTNVTKTETYYRDAYTYRYHVRVHPIPPDGLYTSWDYNRDAMVPTAAEAAAGVPGGRYFTAVRGTGVPIDGINDDIGQIDRVEPIAGMCMTADGPRSAEEYGGTCPVFFDAGDPMLNLPLTMYNWEQVAAKGDLGSLVYLFELKSPTIGANAVALPYYRDDACLDDATGDDPVARPYPGESYSWNDGAVPKAYQDLDGNGQVDCHERQGAHAQHGVHFLAPPESDNAMMPVPVNEIDGQQWAFAVPTAAPTNVGERYANIVRAPLVKAVTPRPAAGGGGQDLGGDYETCVAMAQEGGAAEHEAAAKFACAVVFGGGRGEGEDGAGQIQGPNTYVPMADGTMIATNVYVPWACNVAKNPAATPCPAILEMSGYESGSDEGQTPAGDVDDILREEIGQGGLPLTSGTRGAHDRYYKSGERYVSVVASVRGTGCSAGEFDVFSRKSAEDGKYLIDEWMAKQAWSNGKVGIFGHSYSGITGAMIASTAPEHLEVVSVSGQIGDIYRDIVYPGGVSNYGFPLLWTGGVRPAYDYLGGSFAGLISDSSDRQCLQNQAARSRTTEDPLVVGLADTDTRWMQERSVVNYLYNVKAPTHITTAYQDEQTGPRGGTHVFDKLPQDVTRRLVMLNGDHGTQTGPAEVTAERRYWLDRFLLDANDPNPNRRPRNWSPGSTLPAPVFANDGTATSRVLLEVAAGNRLSNGHIDSSGFPLSQTQWTDFYFQADGSLDTAKSTVHEGEAGASSSYFSGSKRQLYSYQAGKNEGGAVSAAEADGVDELVFALDVDSVAQGYTDTAGAAQSAFVIAGPITAKLFLSASGGDTELMVQLIDLDPATGERLYLQRGVLKASHRAIESQHSQCAAFPAGGRITSRECTLADNLYRPHRPHVNPETILPGVVNEYLLEVFPVGHVLRAGHRLLVKVHAPALDDNDWAYIQKTPPGINTLHHSAEFASSIRLPVVPVAAASRLGPPTGTCSDNQMRCIVAGADPSSDYRSQCHDYAPTALGQMVCNTFDTLASIVFAGEGGDAQPGNDAGAQTGAAFNTIGTALEGLLGDDALPQGRMLAGVGVVDMTPELGYSSGQHGDDGSTLTGAVGGGIDPFLAGRRKDSADGVQGRMTGRAIVLEGSNGKRIALLKSDNYLAQDHLVRRVGQILAEQGSSIGYDQILYGVTHDHSSPYYATPSAGVWVFQDAYDPKFMEFQARRLAQAIMTAEAGLKPARLGATTVHHKVYKGNVTKPQRADDGTPAGYPRDYGDKGVVVMRIDTDEAQPQPIAVWVNWGQHPEALGGYNLQSADYVSHLERFVEREIGAPVVFSQGDVGSSENTGNDQQRIADDGHVCQGPGKNGESCAAGEGVWRDWYHKGFAQSERGGRFLADAVLKGWNALGVPDGEANPYVGGDPMANNYIASVQVPMTNGFPVDFRNAWVPGPLSHPYPGVSPCRTETTAEGNPGVPNAADCTRPSGSNTKAQMVWETLKEHGIPLPENYELPAFGTVEENLRLRLQAFRIGDIVLGSCACEAQVDLILNFESRANDVQGDIYDGFDWACVIDGLKDDPQYAAACETQKQHYDPAEYPYDLAPDGGATNRSLADIARMRAQVHNPADGWDAPEYVPYANAEPADVTQIKGNFTKEELPSAHGYKLAVGVGHAGDYVGYTVSYREYMAYDHYRKELTSYGPHTADYMVTRLVRMAGAMKGAPELKAEPHDTMAQADEARQLAASAALGQAAKAQYESFYGALAPDVGPAAPSAQPGDISWFQATTFTWRGGSTAVDAPVAVVEKKCEPADLADASRPWLARRCTEAGVGNYATFADGSGEVQTTVKWADPAGVAMTYAGQQEWLWTANFEAFKAFPARLGDTPRGTYRFAVAGCINSLEADSLGQRLGNLLLGLVPQLAAVYSEGQGECRGGAVPYAFASEDFEVADGVDRVVGVSANASGDLAISVADRSIPKSYESDFFAYPSAPAGEPKYCEQCSFRPWAWSAAAPVSVEVDVGGVKTAATGSGTNWNAAVGLAVGQSADVTVTYADGIVSRPFRYTRAGTAPVDGDGDGVPDAADNCPAASNADQADNDADGAGNACDSTPDGDAGPGFPVPLCLPEGSPEEGCLSDLDDGATQGVLDTVYNTVYNAVFGGGGEPPVDPYGVMIPASDEIDTASTGGKIYQIYLPSADNGEVIAFSVFEPSAFDLVKGNALVLQGHGYGLKRSHTPDGPAGDPNSPLPTSGAQFGYSGGLVGDMTQYVAANFWVISIDQRGFGESEGTVRLMDPDHEGRNLLQIIDWAEANLPHLMYRTEAAHPNYHAGKNLVLGSTGGSYGGAYQNLILAIDPKERLDAMVPQITWHDLSYSLAGGGVTKSGYALGLAAAGEASSRGRQDPFVREQLIASGMTNKATPELLEALRYHSLKYWCDGGFGNVATDGVSDEGTPFRAAKPLPKVDALLFQGMHDALFNISEAIDSYDCLKARGGDVRMYTYQFGHVMPSGTDMATATPISGCSGADCFGMFGDYTGYGLQDASSAMSCGPYKVANMELDWMKSKLQGDPAATAALASTPATCLELDSTGDAVTLGVNPRVAPLTTTTIPKTNVVLNGAQFQPVPIKLTTVGANTVLAGIPKATITLSTPSPVPPQFVPEIGVSEPIVFVGLARGRFDYGNYCHQYADPYPFAPVVFCTPVEAAQAPLADTGLNASMPSHLELIDDQIIPIRGLGTHTIDLQGVGERLAKGEQINLVVYGFHPLYVVSGSRQPATLPLQVTGSVQLPLQGNLPKLAP